MNDRIISAFSEIQADKELIDETLTYLLKKSKKSKPSGIQLRIGFASVAVFAGLIVFFNNFYYTAVAYISIDVNPSIEFTLNSFDKVIKVYAFNESGIEIVNGTDFSGKTYEEAAKLLLSLIKYEELIAENSLISITVQAENNNKESKLCETLADYIDKILLSDEYKTEIEVFPVTSEIWNEAHGCNMSPARFLAVQELMEVDDTAEIDDYTDVPIHQIRHRTEECRNAHGETDNGSSGHGNQNGHGHDH